MLGPVGQNNIVGTGTVHAIHTDSSRGLGHGSAQEKNQHKMQTARWNINVKPIKQHVMSRKTSRLGS